MSSNSFPYIKLNTKGDAKKNLTPLFELFPGDLDELPKTGHKHETAPTVYEN